MYKLENVLYWDLETWEESHLLTSSLQRLGLTLTQGYGWAVHGSDLDQLMGYEEST